ncbi:helix-turn-helix domain-containing protein [Streptomyces aureus]|uniref:helix-turn-helix domain-containing protein n=1 Tax=Streptomyces aureus TaxID=193461 RepID=UPI003629BACF
MASLRALECLVAVADSGSITQAALLLHSSQPAVSHQLASLERETRTLLLRREPRGSSSLPQVVPPSRMPDERSKRPPPR